ncbi:MAG: hypothetical protein ARM1_0025 [Candidatus Micrarchaeota archaeon]|nr:MAG: hypothetical protein ARM1_0025 [Candidatus Micrarchaeota archaeon]
MQIVKKLNGKSIDKSYEEELNQILRGLYAFSILAEIALKGAIIIESIKEGDKAVKFLYNNYGRTSFKRAAVVIIVETACNEELSRKLHKNLDRRAFLEPLLIYKDKSLVRVYLNKRCSNRGKSDNAISLIESIVKAFYETVSKKDILILRDDIYNINKLSVALGRISKIRDKIVNLRDTAESDKIKESYSYFEHLTLIKMIDTNTSEIKTVDNRYIRQIISRLEEISNIIRE